MHTPPTTPHYPIPLPDSSDDARFTIGLAIDVAAVGQHWGYPPITTDRDVIRLQHALFTMIYREKSNS